MNSLIPIYTNTQSTKDIIDILLNHRQVCAMIVILDNLLEQNSDQDISDSVMLNVNYTSLVQRRDMVEAWLELLPTDERFLVQTHLINGLDWAKTMVEHEKMWGSMSGRSIRSLKRIQAKSINRITQCLTQLSQWVPANSSNILS